MATGPIPIISDALKKRLRLSLATQGGDLANEFFLAFDRAFEIANLTIENAVFPQKTVQLNEGGTTAGLTGAGFDLFGDSGLVVGFMHVNSADTSLFQLRAPTANTLTFDMIGEATLLMSANLSVTGVSAINQDVTIEASPTWVQTSVTGTDMILDSDGFSTTLRSSSTAARILTLPDVTGTLATLADVQSADELSEILANGNTTGVNDLIVTIGQKITTDKIQQTVSGGIDIDMTSADVYQLTTDGGSFAEGVLLIEPTYTELSNYTNSDWAAHYIVSNATKSDQVGMVMEDFGIELRQKNATPDNQISIGLMMQDITLSALSTGGTTSVKVGAILNSKGSSIAQNLTGTVVIGGKGFAATVSDTIYMPNIDLSQHGVDNAILNLGADSQIRWDSTNNFFGFQDSNFDWRSEMGMHLRYNADNDVGDDFNITEEGRIRLSIGGAPSTLQIEGSLTSPDPHLRLYGTNAAAAANIVSLAFAHKNSSGGSSNIDYGVIVSEIVDPTAASEDGILRFQVIIAGSLTTKVTLTGTEIDIVGGIITDGTVVHKNTTTSSGAGAVAITGAIHEITTAATGDALTLANGAEGQVIRVVYVAETAGGDTAILTPTSLAGTDTTITFNDLGDTATLLFTAGAWFGVGVKDAVFA